MATTIAWATDSWNPIRARNLETGRIGWHCERISEGCRNCYAERKNLGFFQLGTGFKYNKRAPDQIEVYLDEEALLQPLHWKKPRKIFPCSMTDWMGAWVPDEWIDKMLAVAALCPRHQFLFLTKRAERLPQYFANSAPLGIDRAYGQHSALMKKAGIGVSVWPGWPLPNVWLGVSAEDQKTYDERSTYLAQTPAAIRWMSLEPMIGPIDPRFTGRTCSCLGTCKGPLGLGAGYRCALLENFKPDWIVLGGESGHHSRPFNVQWARDIIGQCKDADIPVFMKQMGAKPFPAIEDLGRWNSEWPEHVTMTGSQIYLRDRKGEDPSEWPVDLRVRQYPEVNHAR